MVALTEPGAGPDAQRSPPDASRVDLAKVVLFTDVGYVGHGVHVEHLLGRLGQALDAFVAM